MHTIIIFVVGGGLWGQWTFQFSETKIKVCSKSVSWHSGRGEGKDSIVEGRKRIVE